MRNRISQQLDVYGFMMQDICKQSVHEQCVIIAEKVHFYCCSVCSSAVWVRQYKECSVQKCNCSGTVTDLQFQCLSVPCIRYCCYFRLVGILLSFSRHTGIVVLHTTTIVSYLSMLHHLHIARSKQEGGQSGQAYCDNITRNQSE